MRIRSRSLSLLLVLSCGGDGAPGEQVDAAKGRASAAAGKARDAVTEFKGRADATKDAVREKTGVAKAWASDLTHNGTLSETARGWLDGADGSKIAAIVAKGEQLSPAALAIAGSLAAAYESDTAIEPVYQKIDPASGEVTTKAVDDAIHEMGRVEVIDGVSIGFKELTSTTAEKRVTEKGYLVLWRRDDHLVGFVYRSRKEIDLEKLVADAPRLYGLVEEGLGGGAATPSE
ncbi:MAG: hypothetical protein R3A51_03580 [Nannocystaceae bacterium]